MLQQLRMITMTRVPAWPMPANPCRGLDTSTSSTMSQQRRNAGFVAENAKIAVFSLQNLRHPRCLQNLLFRSQYLRVSFFVAIPTVVGHNFCEGPAVSLVSFFNFCHETCDLPFLRPHLQFLHPSAAPFASLSAKLPT